MNELTIQHVLGAKFRTSSTGEKLTKALMENLGLSTKASVARLAIGISLSLEALPDDKLDARGLEIPASSLFNSRDVALWVGLCVTHSAKFSAKTIATLDDLRLEIRKHWHRGVEILSADWDTCGKDYDKFIDVLTHRRSHLPEFSQQSCVNTTQTSNDDPKISLPTFNLVDALKELSVQGEITQVIDGPRITRYRIYFSDINMYEKLSKSLERLSLVLNLQAGVPSLVRGDEAKTGYLDIPRSKANWKSCNFNLIKDWHARTSSLPNELLLFPGVDTVGEPIVFDLAKAPHLFVGGATGQGKSVCLHAMITSLMLKHDSNSLNLALIDPKFVEFSAYRGSKYLYSGSIAGSINEARSLLESVVSEMEERYLYFQTIDVRNMQEANEKGSNYKYLVVFIEELADLILQGRDLEDLIVRLAQKSRAAGIHLVLATQRPDAKTFSGLIRSNVPARIALTVQKSSESKIILDEVGAEDLLGYGDMLVKVTGTNVTRGHGVYVEQSDIEIVLGQ